MFDYDMPETVVWPLDYLKEDDGMGNRSMKRKKDLGLLAAVIIAAGLLVAAIVPLISAGIMNGKYREFISRYTDSMAASRKTGFVSVVMDSGKQAVETDKVGSVYTLIIDAGMGKPQSAVPEGSPIEIRFPDSSAIQFWEAEITDKSAERESGLFVRYQGPDGFEYKYDTDKMTLQAVAGKLNP